MEAGQQGQKSGDDSARGPGRGRESVDLQGREEQEERDGQGKVAIEGAPGWREIEEGQERVGEERPWPMLARPPDARRRDDNGAQNGHGGRQTHRLDVVVSEDLPPHGECLHLSALDELTLSRDLSHETVHVKETVGLRNREGQERSRAAEGVHQQTIARGQAHHTRPDQEREHGCGENG